MENASKALIIAGSILLAVLIVAMGVSIFNKAKSGASTEALDSAEITMFNSGFEKYATDNSSTIKGSQVKNLLSFAISNASTNQDEPTKLPTFELDGMPSVDGGTSAASSQIQNYIDGISGLKNNVTSTKDYHVICHYAKTGLIDKITIN